MIKLVVAVIMDLYKFGMSREVQNLLWLHQYKSLIMIQLLTFNGYSAKQVQNALLPQLMEELYGGTQESFKMDPWRH